MSRKLVLVAVFAFVLAIPGTASAGHGLKSAWLKAYYDHPMPAFAPTLPPSPVFSSGGPGADWNLIASIPTGNGHTDIDYFTQGGETYASVGTLAIGPNGGGQSIVQLTKNGQVTQSSPKFIAGHPSAECPSNPRNALGLQHDVEATPKGGTLLNATNPGAVNTEAQLLVDATDSRGRCHDSSEFGVETTPRGGLELVDITDVTKPKEIGLTSHAGESHTVNVDPKRPHIAYSVTSDSVSVSADGVRKNEDPNPTNSERFNLDGFEVVDMSSCMYFPKGMSIIEKRLACRPVVYRYRWPSADIALGHTNKNAIYGCHELEVYANDRLTCGSGAALIMFDMRGAFDNRGTKTPLDDKPRGTPLPCRVRGSMSNPPFKTGALVTDCVDGTGEGTEDLNIPNWLASGAPSLTGVRYLGSVHHQGRNATGQITYPSTEDIDFNHEAELTASGRYLLATDERGGGVTPPGATCTPGADNPEGNGGVHAYDVSKLQTTMPTSVPEAWKPYARSSSGAKAIYRAQVRTKPQATVCTAHVMHQIPGQNRIFMAWYSQGTQVIDFTENRDGTLDFKEAGWFIPANANEWVSAIFKVQKNANGTFTYWGATGDFSLGEAGRNTIDIYQVTLPAPPKPRVR
jgi:hypothetical protein